MSPPSIRAKILVRVQKEDFDVAKESKDLCSGNLNIGGLVCFTGICRDEDAKIESLTLEHYPEMAQKQMMNIAEQACSRWSLYGISLIHRVGIIEPGENIVLVCAAARHRHAAFEAAQFAMDFLKTNAPFWKKEMTKDGDKWIDTKPKDEVAKDKWE